MSSENQGQFGDTIGQPTVTVVASYDDMSRRAADIVAETIASDPACAITVPTGSTPVGMYAELVRRVKAGELDVSRVSIFCLDDYRGTTWEDPASLTKLLKHEFLIPANVPDELVHYMPTMADDAEQATAAYEEAIVAAGGLSLAVIGLGPNGHVAFNEPGSGPETRTRVLDLTQQSRDQNAAYYEAGAKIPEQAMTMGLGTILDAKRIVMIVNGEAKAGIVKQMLTGPMTADLPASWMRLAGDRFEVILDQAAAAELDQTR